MNESVMPAWFAGVKAVLTGEPGERTLDGTRREGFSKIERPVRPMA
jgi:hypothetical protein